MKETILAFLVSLYYWGCLYIAPLGKKIFQGFHILSKVLCIKLIYSPEWHIFLTNINELKEPVRNLRALSSHPATFNNSYVQIHRSPSLLNHFNNCIEIPLFILFKTALLHCIKFHLPCANSPVFKLSPKFNTSSLHPSLYNLFF